MTSPTIERAGSPDLSDAYPTLAFQARDWAQREPDHVIMRDKDFGIWQERTWAELWDEILTVAHGLLALGVRQGDVVSIHSEDRPEWIIMDIATVAIRAITTGMSAPPMGVTLNTPSDKDKAMINRKTRYEKIPRGS